MEMDENLKLLSLSDNVKGVKKKYYKRKWSVFFFLCICFLAIFFYFYQEGKDKEKLENQIQRPAYGDGEESKKIKLSYEKNGKEVETEIWIDLKEEVLSSEEISEELKACEKKIKKEFLGKNKSPDQVCNPLKLMTSIGEYGCKVTWTIPEGTCIKEDGTLDQEGIDENGKLVVLIADLKLEDQVRSVEFPVLVRKATFIKELTKGVSEAANQDLSKRKVVLPKSFKGIPLNYPKKRDLRPWIWLLLCSVFLLFYLFFYDQKMEKKMKKREEEMRNDYPEIVSRLLLYMKAGLSLVTALRRIVKEYEGLNKTRYAYEEISRLIRDLDQGQDINLSFMKFGHRCKERSYSKLANLLAQNIKKGNQELANLLKDEVEEGYERKKAHALKKGEEVNVLLLIPMLLILLMVVITVLVPVLFAMS